MRSLVFLLLLCFVTEGFAANTRPRKPVRPVQRQQAPAPAQIEAPAPPPASPSPTDSYFQLGARFELSQEYVNATRLGITLPMQMQFQGTNVAITYKKPMNNIRWVWSHSIDAGFGNVKGKGNSSSLIPDFLSQPYYEFHLSPGLVYRTEPPTEVGLSFPITYRKIVWSLGDDTLQMDKASTTAYGVALTYANRITADTTLFASFIDQISLQSTVWSLGIDYAFR